MKINSFCLKEILDKATIRALPSDNSSHFTCVFLLIFDQNGPQLLAIQKSDNEGYPWRNQVALPGGHVDKKDLNNIDAAFRELEEELDIKRNQVEFVGSIGHFQTINHTDIEVFIGLWDMGGAIDYDSKEIARVLEIPLKELIRIHKAKNYHCGSPDRRDLKYPVDDVVIWGVTARILHHFIEILLVA